MFDSNDIRPRVIQSPPVSDPAVGGWIGNIVIVAVVLLFIAVGMDKVSAAAEAYWPGAGWYAGVTQLSVFGALVAAFIVRWLKQAL